MAKSIKSKKDKPVNPPTLTEPIVEETVKVGALSALPENSEAIIIDMPKSEAIEKGIFKEPEIGETPPSVTLDEVKEVGSLVVTEVIPEPKEVPISISPDVLDSIAKQKPHPIKITNNDNTSIEEKIAVFLDSRGSGEIKLNDFLKSLFGVPKFGEPPIWSSQGNSKVLRVTLTKMVTDGLINIQNNNHVKLGTFYYPDMSTGKTEYHTLNTVPIVAIK